GNIPAVRARSELAEYPAGVEPSIFREFLKTVALRNRCRSQPTSVADRLWSWECISLRVLGVFLGGHQRAGLASVADFYSDHPAFAVGVRIDGFRSRSEVFIDFDNLARD